MTVYAVCARVHTEQNGASGNSIRLFVDLLRGITLNQKMLHAVDNKS